jgi:hypothetical protein
MAAAAREKPEISPRTVQAESRVDRVGDAAMSAETLQTRRPGPLPARSFIGGARLDAGRQLHSRANTGPARRDAPNAAHL